MKWMNCAGRKLDLHKFQLMRTTSASGGSFTTVRDKKGSIYPPCIQLELGWLVFLAVEGVGA